MWSFVSPGHRRSGEGVSAPFDPKRSSLESSREQKSPPLCQDPLWISWAFREENPAGLGHRKRNSVLDDIDPRVTLTFLRMCDPKINFVALLGRKAPNQAVLCIPLLAHQKKKNSSSERPVPIIENTCAKNVNNETSQ